MSTAMRTLVAASARVPLAAMLLAVALVPSSIAPTPATPASPATPAPMETAAPVPVDEAVPAPAAPVLVPAVEGPAPAPAPQRAPGSRRPATAPSDHGATAAAPVVKPSGSTTRRLRTADGRLDVPVGNYSDCTGASPLFSNAAAIDTCMTGVLYFVGHNPGVFTPLTSMDVGTVITWWDSNSKPWDLRVVARRVVNRDDGSPRPVSSSVVAQFQTCLVDDGSVDLVLDAVSVSTAPRQVAANTAPSPAPTAAPDPPAAPPAPQPTPTANPYSNPYAWWWYSGGHH